MSPTKNAIITGASGGIGSEVARRLTREGWKLLLVGRSAETLNGLRTELTNQSFFMADISSFEDANRIFEHSIELFESDFSVVNCAGSIVLKPAHLTSESEYRHLVEANLTSAFNVVRLVGKHCSRGASAVLISSCAAQLGLPNHEGIAAVKAAIEGLVRSAAATYSGKGLRFNAVAPGLTRTPLTARIISNPQAEAFSTALHPLGRLGEPADIAASVAFLLSSDASWITGQVLGVDGGLSIAKTAK